MQNKIIDKAGTWFSYGDERLGQGRENVKAYLEQNPELLNTIENRVREACGLGGEGRRKQRATQNRNGAGCLTTDHSHNRAKTANRPLFGVSR